MPNLNELSWRSVNLMVAAFATAMMLVAYFYFQKHLHLLPCPLCVTQRIFTIAFGVIALIASVHNPGLLGQRIYSISVMLAALAGASISGRQIWLQSLPEDQVPACGPTLDYLMEYFPFQDVLTAMFVGEGSCAEVMWNLLGLSIPGWTLVAFGLIIVIGIWQILRRPTT